MKALLATAGLLFLAGCALERPPEKRPLNHYLADPRDLDCIRRVIVLPFSEEPGVTAEKELVRSAYVDELQKLRRFEVVPLPNSVDEIAVLDASMRKGRIGAEEVVSLCNRYRVDAVVLGTITAWRAYTPPRLGMRTQMVSVHSGSIVWAVDSIYDANDRSMVSDLRHYYENVQTHDSMLHTWELDLLSPGRFSHYVAHRFAGTWSEDD